MKKLNGTPLHWIQKLFQYPSRYDLFNKHNFQMVVKGTCGDATTIIHGLSPLGKKSSSETSSQLFSTKGVIVEHSCL